MQKYMIDISKEAKADIKNIIMYIKDILLEPIIAKKYSKLIKENINSLNYSPERFAVIDSELIKGKIYRKLVIRNYIAIYRIDTENNKVHIVRVLYGRRNFENIL
ncbi:MAG: type II toxin-antitoxin system RelE/ParE family toxin [Clostridia bacterium]